jgi:saccharopine dehydrogenase-like NADP-dependent oxidoreductase
MRIAVVGAGGVGAAIARAAVTRDFFDSLIVVDLDGTRARTVADRIADRRVTAGELDASSADAVAEFLRATRADWVVNAADPRANVAIFDGAFAAGCSYVDMAMTLSAPHPEHPFEQPGVMLGDHQLERHEQWCERGMLAIVGLGVEPGFSDVAARYAADELFSSIDEIGVRDGSDLRIEGYAFAPTFSIWTTIEECLNPPLIWERTRGFYTTAPFSEPEPFTFPEGIGTIECVNVEHEEVVLIPRWVDCNRVTFKYGLGDEFIEVLQVLHKTGLDRTSPVRLRDGVEVAPRDVVAAALPDPATLGDRMTGRTCAGTWVRGTGTDGAPRAVYVYHVSDNEQTMRDHGAQAVVWQTAINPVAGLELVAHGAWQGAGVLGPEALPPIPFLDLLRDRGEEWKVDEREL